MKHLLIFTVKKQLILLVTVFAATAGLSQKANFGIRAGVNMAKFDISPSSAAYDVKFKPGVEAGLNADIPIAKRFTVQPELLFSMNGTKMSASGESAKYLVSYLSVPVLVKYHLPKGFAIFAGPKCDYLVRAKSEYGNATQDVKKNLKKTDFSAVAGIVYDFSMGLNISARYNHGFTNISKAGNETSIRNYSFGVSAGYQLSSLRSLRKLNKPLSAFAR